MDPASLAIVGATGRMGSSICRLVETHYADRLAIVARIGSDGSDFDALSDADVVIDVSLPAGTAALVDRLASDDGGPGTVVSGTTGLDGKLEARLNALGRRRKVLHAANFSAGVAALGRILEGAAPMLAELPEDVIAVECESLTLAGYWLEGPETTPDRVDELADRLEAGGRALTDLDARLRRAGDA